MALESTSTLAVLSDDGLLTYSYATKAYARINIFQKLRIDTLAELYAMAAGLEIANLWIAPGSRLSQDAYQLLMTAPRDMAMDMSTARGGIPRFVLIKGSPSVKIAWPEWDDRWPWRRCCDAPTLLKSLLYLQDALEVKVEWSPGHTGQALMEQCNEKHPNWLAPVELPATVKAHTVVDMKWKRPLTKDEQRPGMWFHAFDKNSAYLAACTGVNLGEGEPEHITEHVTFQARVPGLWRIGDTWIWTPELEYLFTEMGDRPEIEEAYVWPCYHQALRSWGEHMWTARQKLKPIEREGYSPEHRPAWQLAYTAIKLIYTQSLGWLTFERPDHWSMIVSGAYRSTAFKKRQMEHQAGLTACFWNADGLGFVSWGKTLEPYQRYMLNRVGMLGGYKHVGSVPVGDLVPYFEDNVSWEECHNAILAALEGVKV